MEVWLPIQDINNVDFLNEDFYCLDLLDRCASVVMIGDFAKFRWELSVNIDVIQIEFEFEIFDHRKKSLVGDICDLREDELQMLDEGMSRPRRPILTPQTFRSVVGIEGNDFVLKNAFVGVSNDLYVFVVVMKLRHEVSNALLNHLSLRVVIEEDCI